MKIIKYGGAILNKPNSFRNLGGILRRSNETALVFSAVGGTSRLLREAAEKAVNSDASYVDSLEQFISIFNTLHADLLGGEFTEADDTHSELLRIIKGIEYTQEAPADVLDHIMQQGEILSSLLLRKYLESEAIDYRHFDSSLHFITDEKHGEAKPQIEAIREILGEQFSELSAPLIIEGYIGRSTSWKATTMGFESSNLTATVFAEIYGVDSIDYISKEMGILSADPEVYEDAIQVESINIHDALMLADAGTRPLSKQSLQFAIDNGLSLKYCDVDGTCHTKISNRVSSSHPVIGLLGDIEAETAILSVLCPKSYSHAASQVMELLEDKTISGSIETIAATKSKLLRLECSGLVKEDFGEIHKIFREKLVEA